MMKPTTLVYYERDAAPAIALAKSLRDGNNSVLVRATVRYPGEERETCDRVLVMPDVSAAGRKDLRRLFENKVEEITVTPPPAEGVPLRRKRVVTATPVNGEADG